MNDELAEAIANAKAELATELAWCKCPEGCMCEHCKPKKIRLARLQVEEAFSKSYEDRFLEILESGKYPMRNRTHTLSEETLDIIIKQLEAVI